MHISKRGRIKVKGFVIDNESKNRTKALKKRKGDLQIWNIHLK